MIKSSQQPNSSDMVDLKSRQTSSTPEATLPSRKFPSEYVGTGKPLPDDQGQESAPTTSGVKTVQCDFFRCSNWINTILKSLLSLTGIIAICSALFVGGMYVGSILTKLADHTTRMDKLETNIFHPNNYPSTNNSIQTIPSNLASSTE